MFLLLVIIYLLPAAIVLAAGIGQMEELDYDIAPHVHYNMMIAKTLSFMFVLSLAAMPGLNAVFASRLAKRNGWL